MTGQSEPGGLPIAVDDASTHHSAASALKGMVSFFSLIHLDITADDMEAMDSKFHLAPVLGAMFGFFTWIVLTCVMFLQDSIGVGTGLMAGIFCLAVVFIGSKFLHFDGLTDFGDGMIVSGDKEKHIHALKDSLVGAGGIGVALTVVLISLGIMSASSVLVLLLVIPMTEVLLRFAQVVAAAYGIAGNGMAGRQVRLTTKGSIAKALVMSLVMCAVMFALSYGTMYIFDVAGAVGLADFLIMFVLGAVSAFAVGYTMSRTANRNFGMVNGDILGATNEISRPVILMVLVVFAFAFIW